MVAANLTLLAALNPKAPAPSAATAPAEPHSGQHFAKLVKAHHVQEGTVRREDHVQHHSHKLEKTEKTASSPKDPKTAAVRSENVPATAHIGTKEAPTEITPRTAAKILKTLAADPAKADALDPVVLGQLTVKLQAVIDSGKAAPLSEILAAATGNDPKELVAFLTKTTAETPVEATARLTAILPVVKLLTRALGERPAADSIDSAEAGPGTMAAENAGAVATVTDITPLANNLLILPQMVQASAPLPAVTIATAVPVEAIGSVDEGSARASIPMATLIPSLALSAEDKKTSLPEVDLPKTSGQQPVAKGDSAKADAVPAAPLPATALPPAIERQLQALNDNRQFLASGLVKDESAPKAPAVNATQNNTAAIQPVLAANTLTGPSAVTAIGNAASNLINHAPVREQVQVAITRAAKEGVEQITIALDPAGLGRVEVKMHTGRDGQTSLSFLVDKPETFDALSRDARGLERSLQEAGLKADSGGMQFNLRQQTQMQSDLGQERRSNQQEANAATGREVVASATAPVTRHYRIGVQDGIDIHA